MQDLRSGPLKQVQQCFEGLKDEDNFLEATPSTITVCLKHWFINTNIWVAKKISDECSEILKMVVILIVLKTINNSVVRVARSCNLEARLFQFMAIFSRMYTTPDYIFSKIFAKNCQCQSIDFFIKQIKLAQFIFP